MVNTLRRRRSIALLIAAGLVAAGFRFTCAAAFAQSAQPCSLLTTDDIQRLTNQTVAAGVATSYAETGFNACRYAWGTELNRYKLEVSIGDASRMFAGLAPDQFKQSLQSTVVPNTADMLISDVGDAAIFKAESPAYAHATALIKGRVLQVSLDGLDARDKKGDVIALLKQAASKF